MYSNCFAYKLMEFERKEKKLCGSDLAIRKSMQKDTVG